MSIPLSEGVDGEDAAAAAAACLRLSASFISLVMPPVGVVETGISLVIPEVVLDSILPLVLDLGSEDLGVLRGSSGGMAGLTNGSLLTEVKALPWVQKVLDRGLG